LFRGDRHWYSTLRPYGVLGALLLAVPAGSQDRRPPQEPATPAPTERRLPNGLSLTSISAYGGGDWLRFSGPEAAILGPNVWTVSTGATADIDWRLASRRTQFTTSYHSGYNHNGRFSSLSGFDHIVNLDFQTDAANRTVFSLTATGQSGPLADSLFSPSYVLSAAQQSSTIDQLADALLRNGAGGLGDSPIDELLAGARRRSGVVYAGVSRSHSRRLTSFLHVGAVRELHSYSQQTLTARIPNFTVGIADLGMSYSLSGRTRITGTGTYTRSYSRLYGATWQSLTVGVERLLGRRSFGSLQTGYARTSEGNGFGRSSYTASGVLGTHRGNHTIAATFRRGVADLHGLGADYTVGLEGAWSWAPHASPWTMGASLGYERLGTSGIGTTLAWMGQANAVRRLSDHFHLELAAVYLTGSGHDLGGLGRRYARISFVWTPGLARAR
jgi:hypothetical protein